MSAPAAASSRAAKSGSAALVPIKGIKSTAGFSAESAPAVRVIWMATLGMITHGSPKFTFFTRKPSPSRTVTRPATDRGLSSHVERIIPPYFSVERRR